MTDQQKTETQQKPEAKGPQVNDQFWYGLSKEWVGQSEANLDKAAERIQKTVAWLWSVYTAGATVGIALSKLSYPIWVTILIALPSLVLIFAYWAASVQAQMPIPAGFDPRAPSEIAAAYEVRVVAKYARLKRSLILSAVAAALVVVALLTASFSQQAAAPDFQAYVHTQGGQDTIALSGDFPADTNIIVRISSTQDTDGVLKEVPYITTSSGELQTNIALDTTAEGYYVTVEWEQDGLLLSLQRIVSPPE